MLTTTDPSGRPSTHAGRQSRNGWPTLEGSVLHGGWDALDDSENRIRSKGEDVQPRFPRGAHLARFKPQSRPRGGSLVRWADRA